MKWSKIGEIGVDSGKFIICDPCYLNNKGDLKIIQNHDSDSLYETLNFSKGHSALAFIGNTIIGDGIFEVFARQNAKGQHEVKIIFG